MMRNADIGFTAFSFGMAAKKAQDQGTRIPKN